MYRRQKSKVAQVAKDTYVIMAFKFRFREGEKGTPAFFLGFHAVTLRLRWLLDTEKPVAASQPSPSRASGDSRGGGPFGARDAKTGHARDSRPKDEADGRNGNGMEVALHCRDAYHTWV